MEDIAEELVGEISDEHDPRQELVSVEPNGRRGHDTPRRAGQVGVRCLPVTTRRSEAWSWNVWGGCRDEAM